jgi:hypothetical protein
MWPSVAVAQLVAALDKDSQLTKVDRAVALNSEEHCKL